VATVACDLWHSSRWEVRIAPARFIDPESTPTVPYFPPCRVMVIVILDSGQIAIQSDRQTDDTHG